jgi:hypothetical protein
MDVESAEVSRSLLQIVQMKLVRRARYRAPIAAGKCETAEGGSHLAFYDISSRCRGATGAVPITTVTRVPGYLSYEIFIFSNLTYCLLRPIYAV